MTFGNLVSVIEYHPFSKWGENITSKDVSEMLQAISRTKVYPQHTDVSYPDHILNCNNLHSNT